MDKNQSNFYSIKKFKNNPKSSNNYNNKFKNFLSNNFKGFQNQNAVKKISINSIKHKESYFPYLYNLIKFDANNSITEEYISKYCLFNEDFNEAVKNEKEIFLTFCVY